MCRVGREPRDRVQDIQGGRSRTRGGPTSTPASRGRRRRQRPRSARAALQWAPLRLRDQEKGGSRSAPTPRARRQEIRQRAKVLDRVASLGSIPAHARDVRTGEQQGSLRRAVRLRHRNDRDGNADRSELTPQCAHEHRIEDDSCRVSVGREGRVESTPADQPAGEARIAAEPIWLDTVRARRARRQHVARRDDDDTGEARREGTPIESVGDRATQPNVGEERSVRMLRMRRSVQLFGVRR